MTGWILYDKDRYSKNQWFADRLTNIGSQFCETELILTENLQFGTRKGGFFFRYKGNEAKCPDFVICRTVFPVLSFALERAGAMVFNNSETSRICNDKRLTYSYVCSPEIPSIDTHIIDRRLNSNTININAVYPQIIKSAAGHGGNEVYLCKSHSDYTQYVEAIPSDEYVEQPLISPCKGDLRVYVMGNLIISSIIRTSSEYRCNYSLGGSASVYSLEDGEKAIVNRVISAIPSQMDFVGIDFLLTNEGLLFNEIEDVVGTRMLYDLTDIDAAEMYMNYVIKRIGN